MPLTGFLLSGILAFMHHDASHVRRVDEQIEDRISAGGCRHRRRLLPDVCKTAAGAFAHRHII